MTTKEEAIRTKPMKRIQMRRSTNLFYLFEENSKGHVTPLTDMLYSKQNKPHSQ